MKMPPTLGSCMMSSTTRLIRLATLTMMASTRSGWSARAYEKGTMPISQVVHSKTPPGMAITFMPSGTRLAMVRDIRLIAGIFDGQGKCSKSSQLMIGPALSLSQPRLPSLTWAEVFRLIWRRMPLKGMREWLKT